MREPCLPRKVGGLGQTRLVQLEREAAARAQRHHGPREQTTKDVVAVGAAIQSKRGLEIGHFPGYLGKHRRRDIRRIGNHKVQTPKGSSRDACAQIALLDAHTIGKSQVVSVFLCKRNRFWRNVRGDEAGIGALVGDGTRDAARARADIGDKQRARLCGSARRSAGAIVVSVLAAKVIADGLL